MQPVSRALVSIVTTAALIVAAATLKGAWGAAAPPRAGHAPAGPAAPVLPAGADVVAPWGSDGGAGTASAPWRTLQHAADQATAGATIYVRSGTYQGTYLTRSGAPGRPITFAAYPGEHPVVSGADGNPSPVRLHNVHDVVLAGLTVTGSRATWGAGISVEAGSSRVELDGVTAADNAGFGIAVSDSTDVTIRDSTITGNGTGIQVSRSGDGTLIEGNAIADNDRMLVNDPAPNNDRGANGIVFYRTSGRILATDNRIWGNRALSHDYGTDGGAFEIFAASNVTMTRNAIWDNDDVLETGTDGADCANNAFTDNIAWAGHGSAPVPGASRGLILRCALGMQVLRNEFEALDSFVYTVLPHAAEFGGSIEGLTIAQNFAMGSRRVLTLGRGLPVSVTIADTFDSAP